jgi:hypothetical protein
MSVRPNNDDFTVVRLDSGFLYVISNVALRRAQEAHRPYRLKCFNNLTLEFVGAACLVHFPGGYMQMPAGCPIGADAIDLPTKIESRDKSKTTASPARGILPFTNESLANNLQSLRPREDIGSHITGKALSKKVKASKGKGKFVAVDKGNGYIQIVRKSKANNP